MFGVEEEDLEDTAQQLVTVISRPRSDPPRAAEDQDMFVLGL